MNRITLFSCLVFFLSCNSEKEAASDNESSSAVVEKSIIHSSAQKTYDYDTSQWRDLTDVDTSIILDLRYATANNFVLEKMYDCPRCFLRPEVATAMSEAQQILKKRGLGLKMYDCYRPRPIQQKLWDKIPDPRYVSNPERGSMHNRGVAVDVTLVNEEGEELEMGTPFDFFGEKAYQYYKDLPDSIINNRRILRRTMRRVGLNPIKTEWWHFSYQIKEFPISDFLWECPEGAE